MIGRSIFRHFGSQKTQYLETTNQILRKGHTSAVAFGELLKSQNQFSSNLTDSTFQKIDLVSKKNLQDYEKLLVKNMSRPSLMNLKFSIGAGVLGLGSTFISKEVNQ